MPGTTRRGTQDYLDLSLELLTHPNALAFPGALQRIGTLRASMHKAAYNISMSGRHGHAMPASFCSGSSSSSSSGSGSSSGSSSSSEAGQELSVEEQRLVAAQLAALVAGLDVTFYPTSEGFTKLRLEYLRSIYRWADWG